jgi:hypothetical protein
MAISCSGTMGGKEGALSPKARNRAKATLDPMPNCTGEPDDLARQFGYRRGERGIGDGLLEQGDQCAFGVLEFERDGKLAAHKLLEQLLAHVALGSGLHKCASCLACSRDAPLGKREVRRRLGRHSELLRCPAASLRLAVLVLTICTSILILKEGLKGSAVLDDFETIEETI